MKTPVMQAKKGKLSGQTIVAAINWGAYTKNFNKVPDEQLVSSVAKMLLLTPPSGKEAVVRQYANASNREEAIRLATIQWMGTPEYQLC
jgi:hypothetical protein